MRWMLRLWPLLLRVERVRRGGHWELIRLVPDEEGLAVQREDGPPVRTFRWNEVAEIWTFKLDCFVVDDIRLAFRVADGWWYEFSEDGEGFFDLRQKIEAVFAEIPEDWYGTVMQPPFARNGRRLYPR